MNRPIVASVCCSCAPATPAAARWRRGGPRALKSDAIEAYSAGVEPHGMNRLAVRAMGEAGVDIGGGRSKHVDELAGVAFDVVVTVCGHANETCPTLPGGPRVVHVGFDDPPKLAAGATTDDEAMPHYRRVRDEIRAFVARIEDVLATPEPQRKDRSMSQAESKSCCGPDCCDDASAVTLAVKRQYGATARSGLSSDRADVRAVAQAFGYTPEQLASIPAEANMGLSCGNPVATANLRPGEVVVDLGSGGGLDVFLAADKVGPTGRAIGIDVTPEMVGRARRNAGGRANVEFHEASIDALPLADASVDVVISNCVINLAPDKARVFREIARVLKPGGRVAVSDIALRRALPAELASSAAAWCGCVAGAIPVADYVAGLRAAGLRDVAVVETGADLNAYAQVEGQSACCAPPAPAAESKTLPLAAAGCCASEPAAGVHADLAALLARHDLNAYAASVQVYAIKP